MNESMVDFTYTGKLVFQPGGELGKALLQEQAVQANTDYHDITSARLVLDPQQAERSKLVLNLKKKKKRQEE